MQEIMREKIQEITTDYKIEKDNIFKQTKIEKDIIVEQTNN